MAQPTSYVPSFDFSDFSTSNPATPQPGVSLDAQFNAIKLTTDEVLENLALIQRDDGDLANGSVNYETLSNTVKALLGSAILPRGDWVTATAYAVLDLVSESGSTYICATAHTSGVFATDLAADKWILWAAGGSVTVNDSNWSGTDLSVPNGGTGRSTHTAYAVVCGGTSSTAAQQSIASVGTAAQVLTSNGAGALPTFQTLLVDEDDMASDSATLAPSQQSVKAYVDGGLVDGFLTYAKIATAAIGSVAELVAGTASKLVDATTLKSFLQDNDVQKILHLQHSTASATGGGTSVDTTWNTAPLNTKVTDTIGSTLSTNTFTLPAGTYDIDAVSSYYADNGNQLRLYNTTDTAVTLLGVSTYGRNSTANGGVTTLRGRFTIAGTKTFRLEHYTVVGTVTSGLGFAVGTGTNNIYRDVLVKKVA